MPRKRNEPSAGSWAEELNGYTASKQTAPDLPQIHRFVRKDPSAREAAAREFDIVTNTVPNPATAERCREKEAEQAVAHVNRAVKKHLDKAYHAYNIVTNEPVYGISAESCTAQGGNQEPRGKLMKSRPKDDRSVLTLGNEPLKPEEMPKQKKPRNVRQTHIISHRYLKDHDVREEADRRKARDKVEAVSANTCEFNPLTGKFYNADQERLRVAEDEFAERKQRERVADHTYKTSKIVERSEGHAFDIVTNNVYNKEKVLKLEQSTMKGIPQRANLRLKWDYQRDVEESLRDADVDRALNRMSAERSEEVARRGYDVLSNQPLAATAPAGKKRTKPSEQPVLDRLHDRMETRNATTSSVLQESGPRTTNERLFQTPGSAVLSHVTTFNGRQELLVPSLKRALGQPLTGFSA